METTLLTTGLVCLIAAIIGGGLKAFGIELPLVNSIPRQILLGGLGLVLVFAGKISSTPPPVPPGAEKLTPSPRISPTCKEAFSDEFDSGLNPGWVLEDPGNDARYNVAERPGFLHIAVPPCAPSQQCNDLFPGNNFAAPRFVQHINGDFTVMTRLDFDPHYQYQGAGILVWQDENNFLRLERSRGDVVNNKPGVHLDKREKSGPYTAIPSTEVQPTNATQVELRMKRVGDHFTASWREPGGIWRLVGETDIHLSDIKVGLDLIAQHNVPEPTIVDYDYFHVLCDSSP
jgi:hypothetical protein